MCNSFKETACVARSALMASVTLASGALAGVIPTARIRPLSKSCSTCRLYPSTRTLRLLRPWRICPSSALIRRSLATPLIRLAFPASSTCTSCSLTRLRNFQRGLNQIGLFLWQGLPFHFLTDALGREHPDKDSFPSRAHSERCKAMRSWIWLAHIVESMRAVPSQREHGHGEVPLPG